MKIQRRHLGGLTTLLALGALLGPGCAENQSSLFVRGAMLVPSDTCEVSADASATLIFRGVLDLAFTTEYRGVLLVGNQMVRRGNSASLRTETSRVSFESADVRILDAAGNELGAFSAPASGFVDPSTGTEPGYGTVSVVMVDSGSAAGAVGGADGGSRTPVEVVANVIVRGTTLGGEEIATGEWQFPIDVCRGCLVFFPGEADDPLVPGTDCSIRDDAPSLCRVGLDSPVDCRFCSGSNSICDAP